MTRLRQTLPNPFGKKASYGSDPASAARTICIFVRIVVTNISTSAQAANAVFVSTTRRRIAPIVTNISVKIARANFVTDACGASAIRVQTSNSYMIVEYVGATFVTLVVGTMISST